LILVEALQSGHLAGAASDVHHTEPAAENESLLNMNQVILTPHLGGGSRRMACMMLKKCYLRFKES